MIVGDSVHEYVAWAKGLVNAVKHGIELLDEEICRGLVTGVSPALKFAHVGFDPRIDFSLTELEQAHVNVDELTKQPNGAGGHVLAVDFRNRSGQGGEAGGVKAVKVVNAGIMEPAVGMTEETIRNRSNRSNSSFFRGSSSRRNIFRSINRHSGNSSINRRRNRFRGDETHKYVRNAANLGMALPIAPLQWLFSQHPSEISK